MLEFRIESSPRGAEDDAVLHRVKISVGNTVLTRLERLGGSDQPVRDDCLEVPAETLAFWFIDNWWRIRWEPDPPNGFTPEWRLAHDMSSVGGGYLWPSIALWGEGEQLGVAVRADEHDSSLRYLASGEFFVRGTTFETSIDAFVRALLQADTPDAPALEACFRRLTSERADPEVAAWRKLEAQLGHDQDEAPVGLMNSLGRLADDYGLDGVLEAALAGPRGDAALAGQGWDAAGLLEQQIEAARNSAIQLTSPVPAEAIDIDGPSGRPPWQLAEDAARQLRHYIGRPTEPLLNRALSDVVGFDVAGKIRLAQRGSRYGLRLREADDGAHRISLSTGRAASRRFEICRALGDVFWSGGDRLGPLSAANSARQKFQRAFAQSFLCPIESLLAYLRSDKPDADDVEAAARHFHVPIRVIQTMLVNKDVISRSEFERMVAAT